MDISLTEHYRQHRSPQVSALAVLAWALIFSLYALLLKFVLLRKALPMSEAAKSRGTSRVEFAENVASCIVAISTHIYLGPAALMLSLHHQFQGIIAGAVATWFFTEKRRKALQPVFCRATFNAVIKHFGSLAFGSLILAVVQFLKWLMRFLSEQAKVRKNRVLQTIFKILACCLWCFEKCLKFLNKNAYIQVAIKGTNFCTSAQNAFFLILRNAIRFGALAMLGSFLYFIGILVISGATGLGGYYIFQAFHPQMSPIVPTILYVILGYLVGRLFLTVFGLACDTSLQCFIMAEESRMRGDFVPSALQSLMEKQDLGSEEKNGKCCC